MRRGDCHSPAVRARLHVGGELGAQRGAEGQPLVEGLPEAWRGVPSGGARAHRVERRSRRRGSMGGLT